jgi:hypothetical protein
MSGMVLTAIDRCVSCCGFFGHGFLSTNESELHHIFGSSGLSVLGDWRKLLDIKTLQKSMDGIVDLHCDS